MGYNRDFDRLRLAGGLDGGITPTLNNILKAFYVDNNPEYRDDLSFSSYRNSKEITENVWQQFATYVGYDDFNFSDDAEVNEKLVHDFWLTFLNRNYYKTINYGTFDTFATELFAILNEKMPLYNVLIKKRLTDIWVTHDTSMHNEGENTNKGGSTSNSTSKSESGNDTTIKNDTAFTDTPQNQLVIDPTGPDYATTVTGNQTKQTSKDNGEVTGIVENENSGSGTSKLTSSAQGRDLDVFIMTQNWVGSGYGVWLDIFNQIDKAGLFSRTTSIRKSDETQHKTEPNYPGYRWFF